MPAVVKQKKNSLPQNKLVTARLALKFEFIGVSNYFLTLLGANFIATCVTK